MSALELIEQLEALAAKATPRPWEFVPVGTVEYRDYSSVEPCVMDDQEYYPQSVTPENQALCAALVNALPQLAAAVRAMGWRGAETLPEVGEGVLVRLTDPSNGARISIAWRWLHNKSMWTTISGDLYPITEATHWMPIPEVSNA